MAFTTCSTLLNKDFTKLSAVLFFWFYLKPARGKQAGFRKAKLVVNTPATSDDDEANWKYTFIQNFVDMLKLEVLFWDT